MWDHSLHEKIFQVIQMASISIIILNLTIIKFYVLKNVSKCIYTHTCKCAHIHIHMVFKNLVICQLWCLQFCWFPTTVVVGGTTLPKLLRQFDRAAFHRWILFGFCRSCVMQEGREVVALPKQPAFCLLSLFLSLIPAVPVEFLTFSAVRSFLSSGISVEFPHEP